MVLNDFRSQVIEWDKATGVIYESISASKGDSNGRKLIVHVLNEREEEDLTGSVLSLAWHLKENQGLDAFVPIDATKGIFEIYYTTGMLSNIGTLTASLVLVTPDGRIESKPFKIFVQESVVDDTAVQSQDSFTALTQALVRVSDVITSFEALHTEKGNLMDGLYIDKKSDIEALELDYQNRAQTLETTYAPRLTGVEGEIGVARGGAQTLGERLDESDAQLLKKRTFHLSHFISKLKNGQQATIVFLGDSITDDFYVGNGHVAQLEAWLNTKYPNQATVINAGIGGNNIKQMWDRLYKDVLVNKPDAVIVSSGTNDNDGGGALPLTDFKTFYKYLVQEIISSGDIDVVLRNSTPLMDSSRNVNLEKFNAVTKEVANEFNLGFYDIYGMFKKAFETGEIAHSDINLDGTHLNELGQTYIADWFKPFFEATEFVEKPLSQYNVYSGLDGFKIYNTGAIGTSSPNTINGKFFYFNSPSNFVETEFEGEEVSIFYTAGVVQGQFVAEIDGVANPVVDTYAPSTKFRNAVTYKLSPGKHTLKIINQTTKNTNSTSNLLHIQAIIFKENISFPNKDIPTFTDYAWVYQSADQLPVSGASTLFKSNSRVDDNALLAINDGTFTVKKSGVFEFLYSMRCVTTENADIVVRLEVNGSINRKYFYDKTTSFVGQQTKTVDLHEILDLKAGDFIRIYYHVGGTNPKVVLPSLKILRK